MRPPLSACSLEIHCGQAVPRRQTGDLISRRKRHGVRKHHDPISILPHHSGERALEVVVSTDLYGQQWYAQLPGGTLDRVPVGTRARRDRIPQQGHARGSWYSLLQELEILAEYFGGGIVGQSRNVSPWTGHARDEPRAYRISRCRHDDRDLRRCLLNRRDHVAKLP